jgi:hypothetical protein
MNVDDIVAARVEAARRKAANDKRRREELAAARTKGLARRHAAKLRRLAEKGWELAPTLNPDNQSYAASGA